MAVSDNSKYLWKNLILDRKRILNNLHQMINAHEVFPKVNFELKENILNQCNEQLVNFSTLMKKYMSRNLNDNQFIRKLLT